MNAIKITPSTPPVFPCWLWLPRNSHQAPHWTRFAEAVNIVTATHWHPDQLAAPTERPGEELTIEVHVCDGMKSSLSTGKLAPGERGIATPPASDTPMTDAAEFFVATTPKCSPDEGEMHVESAFARTLERSLAATRKRGEEGDRILQALVMQAGDMRDCLIDRGVSDETSDGIQDADAAIAEARAHLTAKETK
jgi:hypothetical protein